MDSIKLLTEKLALSRELATLRPEIDHLRSQVSCNKTLLAEKLSLQRQLSAAQVERETEKRATQRALSKEGGRQAQDEKLEIQFDSLQSELAKERRERQRIERDTQTLSSEFKVKQMILDSRLDAFRTKLRIAKEQLSESQVDLQTNRIHMPVPFERTKNVAKNIRKRTRTQIDGDATIGTPGIEPAKKRTKRSSTLSGDKSMFSITPYLSRTASFAPERPDSNESKKGERNLGKVSEIKNRIDVKSLLDKPEKATSKPATLNKKPDDRDLAKVVNLNTKGAIVRKAKSLPILERVEEEDDDDNQLPADDQGSSSKMASGKLFGKAPFSFGGTLDESTVIKKKRKALAGSLGRILFDEDDGKLGKAGNPGLLRPMKGFGTLGKDPFGTTRLAPKAPIYASINNAFGAFSPLKKDRKRGGV
jgi:hypothetical protein